MQVKVKLVQPVRRCDKETELVNALDIELLNGHGVSKLISQGELLQW